MKLTLEHLKKNQPKLAFFKWVRIWSGEHHAWWGPDGRGYFTDIESAGIYGPQHAWAITHHCCPKKKIVFHNVTRKLK